MLVSFFKMFVLKIDNFTDPGAKNCCSVLGSGWMPSWQACCLPKIMHACWGHKAALRELGRDRPAPARGSVASAPRETSPLTRTQDVLKPGLSLLRGQGSWDWKGEMDKAMILSRQGERKGERKVNCQIKHSETELILWGLLFQ